MYIKLQGFIFWLKGGGGESLSPVSIYVMFCAGSQAKDMDNGWQYLWNQR